jgi:hypothetical protein
MPSGAPEPAAAGVLYVTRIAKRPRRATEYIYPDVLLAKTKIAPV